MPSFRECLRERATVQMLSMSREAAIEVQVHSLQIFGHEIRICITFYDIASIFWGVYQERNSR